MQTICEYNSIYHTCSAVLAHVLLNERLNMFGVMGCILCITGTLSIVLHAPSEKSIDSVVALWSLALQPHFMIYVFLAITAVWYLIWKIPQEVQSSNVLVYVAICSLVGSISVVSCKALGMALKLTLEGHNQLWYAQTYFFLIVVAASVMTQMNYLNKALDLFNTAIVTPIYYVMFTTLTILASTIMFPEVQSPSAMVTELAGFVTIICGTFLLHTTKDVDAPLGTFIALLGQRPNNASSGNLDMEMQARR